MIARAVVVSVALCLSAVGTVLADSPLEVLRSHGPREAKVEACRRLALVGDAAAVPVLAGLLSDAELAHMARHALEAIPGPEAGKALCDAVSKVEGDLLVGVVSSIGVRRDAEAVPLLVALLKDGNLEVVGAAADALARIAAPGAVGAIAALRDASVGAVKVIAADASLVLSDSLRARGDSSGAVAIYRVLDGGEWPERVKLAAFYGLLRSDSPECASVLIGAIEGRNPTRRAMAINRLSHVTSQEVLSDVMKKMHALPAHAQVMLIDVLSKMRVSGFEAALRKALQSESADVRVAAMKALGVAGGADAVPLICGALEGGETESERASAAQSLVNLKGEGIDAALVTVMQAASAEVRPALIRALADRRAVGAVGALMLQARDGRVDVRRAAARALSVLAEAGNLTDLLVVLVWETDEGQRKELERAVSAVARKGVSVDAEVEKVLVALESTHSIPVRCSLLRVLGGIGAARGLPVVKGAVGDRSADVSEAAVRVIADWPDASALDAVLGFVDSVDIPKHKVLLLRGAVRLLGMDERAPQEKVKIYGKLLHGLNDAGEKKLVLAGLAKEGDASAFGVIEPLLGDATVRAEAELAAVTLAASAFAQAPEDAKRIVGRVRDTGSSAAVRKQAASMLANIDKLGGYVTAWQVAGPYLAGERLAPLTGGKEAAKWVPMAVVFDSAQPFMMNIAGALGAGANRLAFAGTSIHCENDTPARLEFGTDDANEVWLNGKSVFATAQDGAAIPGEHKVDVALNKGWNFLLLKVTQVSGPWEFCLRAVRRDGKPLVGVRYQAGREPEAGHWPRVEQKTAAKKTLAPPPLPKGPWTPLFDGKSLDGWETTGDAIFKVEDGCLVGTQTTGKGGDIWHNRELDNFEMRVEYRMHWPANSGFWFRCTKEGRGYQYDVLKHPRPVAFSGSLYCPGKLFVTTNLKESLENRDGWNEALIRADGDELAVWLNGHLVGHCRENSFKKGHVGIQVHGGDHFKGMRIVVRKFDIQDLSI